MLWVLIQGVEQVGSRRFKAVELWKTFYLYPSRILQCDPPLLESTKGTTVQVLYYTLHSRRAQTSEQDGTVDDQIWLI